MIEFINRELSWLEFNTRVLEEAQDKNNKLFERLKFLAITCSNLDEFFMVRVAALKDQVIAGFDKKDPAGLTPKEQLKQIHDKTQGMVNELYTCFNKLNPVLKREGVYFLKIHELNEVQKEFLDDYFREVIYPVLTPMAVDKGRPFPLLANKSLNIGVLISDKKNEKNHIFATVQVPSNLSRFIQLPAPKGEYHYLRLEQVIGIYIQDLFKGREILAITPYRITRNADLSLDEEGAEDLLEAIEESIKKRKWGECVRLEIESNPDKEILKTLADELEVKKDEVFFIDGPIDLTYLMKFSFLPQFNNLRNEIVEPIENKKLKEYASMFDAIAKQDILVHHPYESFSCVLDFILKAAEDPQVLAIKQTLYRVSGDSPIVKALETAAENGKQVMVLVELKARFDEENNIAWAKRLERAGCQVVYGLVGLKTHSKITLVIRKDEDGIRRYVHLGTGNYNDITAKIYTDLGLFTCDPYIGADASAVFNMLSGYSELSELYKLSVAPTNLRKKFIELIEREINNVKLGKPGKIIAKMNSLVDTHIIKELYVASKAGVQITLVIRGICCLKPGVQGISENIKVISIVDRYLEHSRIYYFYNDKNEEIYLSSADWMTRNLDRRVELLFPVQAEEIKNEIKNILDITLNDNVKARELGNDGIYKKISKRGKKSLQSQIELYKYIKNKNL